jgi:Xaa-Pro aminopeptidase
VDTVINHRIASVREAIGRQGLDALLVLIAENRRYLSGFKGEDSAFDESAGVLLIGPERLILATDSRFEIQARTEAPAFEVHIYTQGLARELPQLVASLSARRLGVESRRLSMAQHADITTAAAKAGLEIELVPVEEMVEALRAVKSPAEIASTRAALAIAERAFAEVAAAARPGATEKELAWAMECAARQAGADDMAFTTIVAAGPNSACPHAIPTDRAVAAGEPLLVDWGVRLEGYCSDTTRTFVLGRPDDRFRRIYQVVRQAQQMAIAAIRPGVAARDVDAAARRHIESCGFKDKFGHGLGHGTGLAIHEAPRLSPFSDATLAAGMIVTVEPGIYIEGWGGIRLENQVVVREAGAEVLNSLPFLFE